MAARRGGAVAEVGWGLGGPYYRWLARVRHPVFWGSVLGVALAVAVLMLVIGVVIAPGERRTRERLSDAQRCLTGYYFEQRALPPPLDDHLALQQLDPAQPGQLMLDGWSRPLSYEVDVVEGAVRYRLRSLGFDGRRSRDDLCAGGVLNERVVEEPSTGTGTGRVARAVETAGKVLRWWRKRQARKRGEAPVPEPPAQAASAAGDRVPVEQSRSPPGRC